MTLGSLLATHQYFGYLLFVFALVVFIWSLLSGAAPLPRAVSGALAGLLDLQALIGIISLVMGAVIPWLHPILAVLAAVTAHLASRQGSRSFGSGGSARGYYLATVVLLVAAIGIASM